jgi:hypothetical protein
MERLVQLVSARKSQNLYVLWTERNRISIVKALREHNKMLYKFMHCDWFLTYRVKEEVRQSNTSEWNLSTPKGGNYVIFDGSELKEFNESNYKIPNGIINKLVTSFVSVPTSTKKLTADHLDSVSMTQEIQYLKSIVGNMNNINYMKNWLESDQERYKMMYITLIFLACLAINPSLSVLNAAQAEYNRQISSYFAEGEPVTTKITSKNGFSVKIKQKIIQSWYKTHENQTVKVWIDEKPKEIALIKDCCGLWCISHSFKKEFGSFDSLDNEKDIISAYDIEHIVSNSYDMPLNSVMDRSDGWNYPWNGVLLDSSINRKKGNTMLYLAGDEVVTRIRKKKELQQIWLTKNRVKWYQSFWI